MNTYTIDFSKDFKDKPKKSNAWKAIAEKFHIAVDEVIAKFRNTRTSYRRWLKKQKNPLSGPGRDAVRTPSEFVNLGWLDPFIEHRPRTTNVSVTTASPPSRGSPSPIAEEDVNDDGERGQFKDEQTCNPASLSVESTVD